MNINDGLPMPCDTPIRRLQPMLKRDRGNFKGAGRGRSYFNVLGRSHSVDRVVATDGCKWKRALNRHQASRRS
jgi:hypothetical protein